MGRRQLPDGLFIRQTRKDDIAAIAELIRQVRPDFIAAERKP